MIANPQPSAQAEHRLSAAEARFRRHIGLMGLMTALTIVLTCAAVALGLFVIAKMGVIAILLILGRIIQLIVQQWRSLMAILIDDGLSKDNARREFLRRYGD
jgi:predicted lysophospholipase L1 biosynthesis ABC-type transport system permease subunit